MNDDMHRDIIQYVAHLRAVARMLAQDRALADDLVQETVAQALSHADQFRPGTNLKAWLSAILRNTFFNERRRRGRLSELSPEMLATVEPVSGGQEDQLSLRDFKRAFHRLSGARRTASRASGMRAAPRDAETIRRIFGRLAVFVILAFPARIRQG